MNNTHTSSGVSRRSLAKGATWAAPAILATAAVPAYAASRPGTSTTTQGVYRHLIGIQYPSTCNLATSPQTGYINNLPYSFPSLGGDSKRDPLASRGYWVEGTAGTVTDIAIKTTYTFSHNIQLTASGPYGANVTMPGWTITQVDAKTVTAVYRAPSWQVSTAVAGSGDATGFFLNYKLSSNCLAPKIFAITTNTIMGYMDAKGRQAFRKTTGPTVIQS